MGKKGGKASRQGTKERRKKERRAKKDSMNTQYQRWAEQGINQKSGRASKRVRGRKGPRMRAVDSGNSGCLETNKNLNLPGLVYQKLLTLAGYKNQWSSRYGAQVSEYIRANWHSIEAAWQAHNIVPIRQGIPTSYNEKNWRTI